MPVQSATELFNDTLPKSFANNPAKYSGINAIFFIKINGEGGGAWTVDLTSAAPTVQAGAHGTPNCSIDMAHEDFLAMLANPALGMQFYFQGKLKVTGDAMLATRLQKIFAPA